MNVESVERLFRTVSAIYSKEQVPKLGLRFSYAPTVVKVAVGVVCSGDGIGGGDDFRGFGFMLVEEAEGPNVATAFASLWELVRARVDRDLAVAKHAMSEATR